MRVIGAWLRKSFKNRTVSLLTTQVMDGNLASAEKKIAILSFDVEEVKG